MNILTLQNEQTEMTISFASGKEWTQRMYHWPLTTQAGTVQDYLYADFFFQYTGNFFGDFGQFEKLTHELPSLEI